MTKTENLTIDEAVAQLDGDIEDLMNGPAEPDEDEEQQEAAESDESDEESDDQEEAEEADEDEEAEEEADDDPLVTWETKSGEKIEVPMSELRNGYMRTKDYTQKTQEAAELRRKADEAQSYYSEKADALESALTQWAIDGPSEPDWVALSQNPQEYIRQRAQWDQFQARASEAKAQLAQLRQEAQADKTRRAEEMLLQDFPEWKDPKVAAKGGEELRSAAREFGFSDTDLAEALVSDPRVAKVLLAAGKFHAMQKQPAKIKKRVSEPGKTLRPGAKTTAKQTVTRKQKEAVQRFKQAPTMQNAVEALGDIDLF